MSKKWVLLRGLARGVGHWATFSSVIQSSFPQDEFEFLDLPGNGRRYKEDSPLSVPGIMEAVRNSSAFIQKGERIQLLAVSLGGMVATEWARQYPAEVEGLCLVNTSGANYGKFYERLRLGNLPKLAKIFRAPSVREREELILAMVSNSLRRQQEILPAWVEESTKHPIATKNLFRQLIAASQYRFPPVPPAKTMLLGSTQDNFVSVACTERLAHSWQCPVSLHPWAGHDLPLDDPEWVIDCLKNMQNL